jgi:hypothetical protein
MDRAKEAKEELFTEGKEMYRLLREVSDTAFKRRDSGDITQAEMGKKITQLERLIKRLRAQWLSVTDSEIALDKALGRR